MDPGGTTDPPPASGFTVSGTVSASSGAAVDRDVNDPYAPYLANDSCANAQPLPNPVTLGGYLNAPGAGAAGRSFENGDLNDFYRVSLQANQTVTLYISDDASTNDLDLYLINADSDCTKAVAASEGYGPTETVTAASAGDYYVLVSVYCDSSGNCGTTATNYTLVIGQSGLAAAETLDAGADFVPGEVIVRFADTSRTLGQARAETRIQSLGLVHRAGAPGRNMLLSLGDTAEHASALAALGVTKSLGHALQHHAIEVPPRLRVKLETVAAVRALRARPDVVTADLNYIRHAFAVPSDPFYSYQWHYPQINLPAAWDISKGDGVIVAVIDTGVLLNHPDLKNQLVGGYDFISDPSNALDGNGIDPDPNDPGDQQNGGQSSFHGTHVAGTIAAQTNNNEGVAGVAWNARIMPLRVLGRFGGTDYDILQAVRFAAGLSNDSGTIPPKRADIINLSLGGPGSSSSIQAVYTQVRNEGVIIVAAAGNDNSSVLKYPASYDGVISVSAVDINKKRAPYSSYGAKIDIAAPGGDISRDINGDGYPDGVLSTRGIDGSGSVNFDYWFYNGTSMAAPHVAGVLALMKASNPSLTPQDIDDLLMAGALTEDLGATGWDNQFGWGLIDAFKAVRAAGEEVAPTAVLQATPTSLNFSTTETSLTLQLRNGGTVSLTGIAVTDNADWLTVTPTTSVVNGLGTYEVKVNRGVLEPGTYNATITVNSSAGTVNIPVIMQVAATTAAVGGNTGFQWILLVDPDTLATIDTVSALNVDGVYSFQFTNVPAGRYLVVAGSDADNDDLICDAGESCGAFPTLSQPGEVVVAGNVTGLKFVSSYHFGIGAAGVSSSRPGFSRIPLPAKQMEQ